MSTSMAPGLRTLRCGLVLTAAVLAGCAAGPDFKRPAAPDVASYTASPLGATVATPGVAGGTAQHFVRGGKLAADWWTLFRSQPLDALVRASLANNPDLAAAQAALQVARENALAGAGAYYPSVDAGASATRIQDPPAALAPVPSTNAYRYDLFTPQLSISYAPDVFGGNRRAVESLKAQAQAARFQMLATDTTLTANVVVTAIQAAALHAQIHATNTLLDISRSALKTVKYQQSKGYASGLDVAAQTSQVAQIAATLPALRKQLAQQRNRLAVLCGEFPGAASLPTFTLSSLHLPGTLPVSLPSQLVAQRPDVRQAQANLHAASANIGVAEAARLPQIQLSADVGSTALAIADVFASGTGFWSLATAVAAPIFHGGALLHQQRAAQAAYRQAAAQYRATVLGAFEDVANTLVALQRDADGLKASASAAHAAKVTFQLAQRQEHAGYASHLALLNARQAWLGARIALVQAQATRYADTAALFQALGGGWWQHPNPTKK